MAKALVAVVLGSQADFNILKRGLEALRVMGVPYIFELASPHRNPERLARFAAEAVSQGIEVIICAAGGCGAVAPLLASYTPLPVIAVPIDSTPLRGQDALFSMVQTPPGLPVATVGINNGENAALLATQILAIKYPRLRSVLLHRRVQLSQKQETAYKELFADYPDLVDPARTAPEISRLEHAAESDTDPGPEDVTPEPEPEQQKPAEEKEKTDRIRPGARLGQQWASAPFLSTGADKLISTPVPQEPGTVTEDATLTDGSDEPAPPPKDELPPPSDLYEEPAPPPPPARPAAPPVASGPVFPQAPPPQSQAPTNYGPASIFSNGNLPISAPTPLAIESRERPVDTKVFELDHDDPDEDVLSHAMMVLLEGGIVAFPTDTVYGLAVDATNPDAVRRLYEVKGHVAQRKSLSVLISSPDLLDTLVKEVPPAIESVLERYWPGGLTVLFFKHPSVLASVSDSNHIAIRIPDNRIPISLMNMIQRPLAVINAALGDSPAAIDAQNVIDRFNGRIDCILDAGPCRSSKTSTVLSVISEPFEIIREGAVPMAELRKILGPKLKMN